MIPDLVLGILILLMTYALSSEGLWGAALMFFNALFATMITLNFYEPLAQVIGSNVEFLSGMADSLCILLIFSASLLIIRLMTENMAPAMIRFPMALYQVGRLVFALGGSLITIGVILLAMDAAPVDKKILGAYDYKHKPFYGVRLDKELLAIFQYSSGQIFKRGGAAARDREYGDARVFDPKGDWLLRAQEARPHGTGAILEDEGKAAAPAEGGAAGAPAGKGAPQGGPPGGRGGRPGG